MSFQASLHESVKLDIKSDNPRFSSLNLTQLITENIEVFLINLIFVIIGILDFTFELDYGGLNYGLGSLCFLFSVASQSIWIWDQSR